MLSFSDLGERELVALAISLEEEDSRIYASIADSLQDAYPASATIFREMSVEEDGHRRQLIDSFHDRFGDKIPLIRRQDVRGFIQRKPVWLTRSLSVERARHMAEIMEADNARFYARAAGRATDLSVRRLLGDLAVEEGRHAEVASRLRETLVPGDIEAREEKESQRLFVLRVVQPGLAGLMDGSVSTLAPLFAAAFATQNTWDAFLVGMAASIGAGISMGFAEALSDDGSLTGRGGPLLRGIVCGVMTVIGGLGHTLPYLISSFTVATSIAVLVVVLELAVIAWIRNRYMDTPLLKAAFQVVVGGFLVFATGILIGIS